VKPPLKREDQAAHADHLANQYKAGKIPQIFLAGTLSNRGRHDGKSIATMTAVLYHERLEWGNTECILGEKLTQADIEIEALHPGLTLLEDFVKETNYKGPVQIITGSPSAPRLFLDLTQHATQHVSLEYARKLDSLFTDHPNIYITIQYAKRSCTLVGFKRTQHLALDAVKRPLTNAQRPPLTHYQRAETKAAAIGAWGQ
jgi:hypothetical protein